MMLPLLERDSQLASEVLSRLQMVFYAGDALPAATWARLQSVAIKARGESVCYGLLGFDRNLASDHERALKARTSGCIGIPPPGLELKFVPNGAKLELRVRGVTVFPGYLENDSRPEDGVIFNGRVAEDFKLITGTWVSVGTLRTRPRPNASE